MSHAEEERIGRRTDGITRSVVEALLEQLNPELGMSVLAQCYRIAKLDGVITAEEREVLEAIAQKFDIDLDALERENNDSPKA